MDVNSWRKHTYYSFDPFAAEIEPALLNSHDIRKYVDRGCLIDETDFHPDRLKTATYELRLLGDLHYWEGDKNKLAHRCVPIESGDPVEIPKNSVTYLWTRERLFLPEYIAARYNLHIRHVHRGILLGTGPLVDAGFGGSILIPLHNLTDNDYEMRGGDGIVWVEFTKLSRSNFWQDIGAERPRKLKEFPERKAILHASGYLEQAGVASTGVQSAFKAALNRAESQARRARKDVRQLRRIGLAAGFASVLAFAAVMWAAYGVVHDSISRVQDASNLQLAEELRRQNARIEDLESALDGVRSEVDTGSQLNAAALPGEST